MDKVTHRKWLRKNNSKTKKYGWRANEQKVKINEAIYEAYCDCIFYFVELVCKWSNITPFNNPINKRKTKTIFLTLLHDGRAKSCKIKLEKQKWCEIKTIKRQRWKLISQLRLR